MSISEIISLAVSVVSGLLVLLYRVTIAGLQKDASRHELELASHKALIMAMATQGAVHHERIDRLERDLFRATQGRMTSQADINERG